MAPHRQRGGWCSFCGVRSTPAHGLVEGPEGAAICRACAEVAIAVLDDPDGSPEPDLVLHGISMLLTMDQRRGGLLGVEQDVVVAIRRGRVVWIGDAPDLPAAYRDLPTLDCEGRMVLPGLVDAATAVLGDAPAEAPEPVGLTEATTGLVRRMLQRGVTALDVRVGGGTEPTVDTLHLAVARAVGDRTPAWLSVSWRCAPTLAPAVLADVMAPTAARLASFAVVECTGDRSAVERAVAAVDPLRTRITCCEPEPEACRDALGDAVSVEGVPAQAVAPEGPVLVVPWWEPGRAVSAWRTGRRPALATMSDPGGRVLAGMGVVLMTAVDLAGLELERAMWSVTRAGALALGDAERGWIHLGGPADLVIVDGEGPDDLVRHPDADLAWRVLVGGVEVA